MDSLGSDWEPIIYGNQIVTNICQRQPARWARWPKFSPIFEHYTVFYNSLQHLTPKLLLTIRQRRRVLYGMFSFAYFYLLFWILSKARNNLCFLIIVLYSEGILYTKTKICCYNYQAEKKISTTFLITT